MLLRTGVALLLVALAATACDGDDDDDGGDGATSTPARTAASTPAATVAPDAIRSIDLSQDENVLRMISGTGGEFSRPDVIYADLTEDQREEAIVPISSGGTMGNLGFVVLTLDPGEETARQLLAVTGDRGGMSVAVEDGVLVQIEPLPGPDDPECCPSQLLRTVYEWDGSQLLASPEIISAPDGAATPANTP